MAYEIAFTDLAVNEFKAQRAYDQRRIVDEIERQLRHQPAVSTRNRKCLESVVPEFEHDPPVWELRIGKFRVFYNVEEVEQKVTVRAVRLKKMGQTTGDIIHE